MIYIYIYIYIYAERQRFFGGRYTKDMEGCKNIQGCENVELLYIYVYMYMDTIPPFMCIGMRQIWRENRGGNEKHRGGDNTRKIHRNGERNIEMEIRIQSEGARECGERRGGNRTELSE
jgi:hypothetical protein